MSERILIIDDDEKLAAMLVEYLGSRGMTAEARYDASSGMVAARDGDFDCLVLDVMLPDLDGFEVLRQLRTDTELPVLMLTARGDETDRIVGLELGADDYLPKPFNPRELLARLRAILRRRHPADGAARRQLRFGDLLIDLDAHVAKRGGQPCNMTSYQFELLAVLAQSAGRVLSREQLMERAKGAALEAFDRSIDVHVSRIRAVIEDDPKKPRRIVTQRGVGYMFTKPSEGED